MTFLRLCLGLSALTLSLATLTAPIAPAKAATLAFSYSGTGLDKNKNPYTVSASGDLYAVDSGTPGSMRFIGISGQRNGVAITGLTDTSYLQSFSNSSGTYKNYVISYATSGGDDYLVWSNINANGQNSVEWSLHDIASGKIKFSVSAVPLPGGIGMFGSTLVGLAGFAGLRRKGAATVSA